MEMRVGTRIKFKSEKQAYTVQACDSRYAICNKPFNARKTTLYTIVDFKENVRGPENLIFGMGAETRGQCEEMLKRLNDVSNPSEVSWRHRIALDIEKVG
jgi:hypothetical protein